MNVCMHNIQKNKSKIHNNYVEKGKEEIKKERERDKS